MSGVFYSKAKQMGIDLTEVSILFKKFFSHNLVFFNMFVNQNSESINYRVRTGFMVRTALKRPGISEVGPKRPYIPFEALKRP